MEEKPFKTKDLFFALLRNALWLSEEQIPNELSSIQAEKLLKAAEQQTVSALIADALIRNNVRMQKKQALTAFSILTQIQQSNIQLNEALTSFISLPLPDYRVVKGQTMGPFYPNPLLRTPGDIDFLVSDYNQARSVLENNWHIELPKRLIEKEYAFTHQGVTYEIHTKLISFGSIRNQRYWDSLMQGSHNVVVANGVNIPTLEPTINAVYLFVHIFFHFIREGVGIRQMCDWALFLHHQNSAINWQELEITLNRLGLIKAYRAFICILKEHLGLEDIPIETNEKDHRMSVLILSNILRGGNFGHNTRASNQTSWRYKIETLRITISNCLHYFWLAPIELSLMIPKLIWLNIKLTFLKQ